MKHVTPKFIKSRSQTSRFRNMALIAGSMLLSLIATQANAVNNYTYYQGTMCEPRSDGYHWNSQNVNYLYTGAILNNDSSRAIALACPGVTHNFASYVDGLIRIYKSDASEYTSCTLQSVNSNGTVGSFSNKVAPAGTGTKTLFFDRINDGYTHNVTCLLPRKVAGQKSGVLSYSIYELN